MKYRVTDIIGQLQTFTQFHDDGSNETLRLKSRKSIIIDANELPEDIKLAEKRGFVFVQKLNEDSVVVLRDENQ